MKLKIYKSDLKIRNESNRGAWNMDELFIEAKGSIMGRLLTFER